MTEHTFFMPKIPVFNIKTKIDDKYPTKMTKYTWFLIPKIPLVNIKTKIYDNSYEQKNIKYKNTRPSQASPVHPYPTRIATRITLNYMEFLKKNQFFYIKHPIASSVWTRWSSSVFSTIPSQQFSTFTCSYNKNSPIIQLFISSQQFSTFTLMIWRRFTHQYLRFHL